MAERRVHAVELDTVFSTGGSLQDTLLLMPRLLAARGERFYTYDYGDSQVKAFTSDGVLLWRFGGAGEGPGEFRNPFDIEVGPDGALWVPDAGLGRLTVLSPDGDLRELIRLHGVLIRDIVPLAGEILATPVSDDDVAWVALAPDGQISVRGTWPLEELRAAHGSVRWTVAAAAEDGHTWAAVFPLGNTLLVYDGRVLRCHGTLVEGEPLPVAAGDVTQPQIWAAAILVADSTVVVLPRGRTEQRLRMLDEYSATDSSYRRSIPLPGRITAMAAMGSTYVFAYEDPAPGIVGIRPGNGPSTVR